MFDNSLKSIIYFIIVVTLLLLVIVVFVFSLLVRYLEKQQQYQMGIKRLNETHENNLLKAKIQVQEQTFQNISREIHDNIGQKLTLVKLRLNAEESVAMGSQKDMLFSMVNILTECISDLRDLSRSLSSDHIANNGFIKALENEIFQLNKLGKIKFTLRITGDSMFLSADKEIVIFRIIQEALNNVVKHAEANSVLISLYFTELFLTIDIVDDGKGFDPERVKDSNGINNIIRRAELLKGKAEFKSGKGSGTVVTIKLPYNE